MDFGPFENRKVHWGKDSGADGGREADKLKRTKDFAHRGS